jgi:hypothetical protein
VQKYHLFSTKFKVYLQMFLAKKSFMQAADLQEFAGFGSAF